MKISPLGRVYAEGSWLPGSVTGCQMNDSPRGVREALGAWNIAAQSVLGDRRPIRAQPSGGLEGHATGTGVSKPSGGC